MNGMELSRISQLSQAIAINTEILDKWFKESGKKQPSFDADGPTWEDEPLSEDIANAKIAVEDAALELRQILIGPRKLIQDAVVENSFSTETVFRAGLPHHVPLNDPKGISYAELSRKTGIDEIALTKIIRLSIARRLFREPSPGMVAHSTATHFWANNREQMDNWVEYFLEEGVGVMPYVWKALQKYPGADEPTQSATALMQRDKFYNGEGDLEGMYAAMNHDPFRAKRFAAVMGTFQKGPGFDPKHAVKGYDWASLPVGSTIVDLGGSHGEIAQAVSKQFSHLNFVIQDLPETIKSAPKLPDNTPIRFMAHDFFQPQPIKGAKIYFFRWIFHNWSDKYGAKILQALIPALEPGSRVLVMDVVVPPMGLLPNTIDREIRWMDMGMMALFNAGDRPAEQWECLFRKADARFKYQGVKMIPGSRMSLIEATWEP